MNPFSKLIEFSFGKKVLIASFIDLQRGWDFRLLFKKCSNIYFPSEQIFHSDQLLSALMPDPAR